MPHSAVGYQGILGPLLAYIPLFLENRSIFSHEIFCRCSWYYSECHYIFCIFSYHDPLCWGAFWNIFGLVLGNCSSYILKFCTDIFRITLTVIIPKFIFLIISKGAGGYLRVFFAHFGVLFLYFLRAVQHFAQNFVLMFLTLL